MGFSRQEYWSGLPFLSPRYLPDPGIEPRSPALQVDSLSSEPLRNLYVNIMLPLRISFTFILLHIHYHTKNRGWTLSCLENIYLDARPFLNYFSLFHFDFFYRTVQPHLHGHLALEAKVLIQLSQR